MKNRLVEGLEGITSRSKGDLGRILHVKIVRKRVGKDPIASIAVPWDDLEATNPRMDDFGGTREGS